jgi:hypothetical protein
MQSEQRPVKENRTLKVFFLLCDIITRRLGVRGFGVGVTHCKSSLRLQIFLFKVLALCIIAQSIFFTLAPCESGKE